MINSFDWIDSLEQGFSKSCYTKTGQVLRQGRDKL